MSVFSMTAAEGSANNFHDRIGYFFVTCSTFGSMIFGLLEKVWLNTIWYVCFHLCKQFWLKAPHMLGGQEGRHEADICSTYFGVNNSLLYTDVGQKMCDEKINSKVSSFATVLLTVIFLVVGYYMVKKNLFDSPKPIPDKNNTKHLVSWRRFAKVVLKLRMQTFCIKAARKILRSPDKTLQEQICALHRLLLPGKDHNAWPEQDQHQLVLTSGSSTEQNEEEEGEEEDDDDDDEEEWNDEDEEEDDDEEEEEEEEEVREEETKPPNTRGRMQQQPTPSNRRRK